MRAAQAGQAEKKKKESGSTSASPPNALVLYMGRPTYSWKEQGLREGGMRRVEKAPIVLEIVHPWKFKTIKPGESSVKSLVKQRWFGKNHYNNGCKLGTMGWSFTTWNSDWSSELGAIHVT